ncbi:MAG: ribose 5-phosphate isomerase B [Actinomycetales bacterium]|nr:ribose 5-phosphate isomerase B [Actinomycetales bacterium]
MAVVTAGADHGGYVLKSELVAWLRDHGHAVTDVGTDSPDPTDYPLYAGAVARHVAAHPGEVGLLICGSGQGVCMTANRVPGVRAALLRTPQDAQLARLHNDATIACFGGRVTGIDEATAILATFLDTPFEGGRHAGRVRLMDEQV